MIKGTSDNHFCSTDVAHSENVPKRKEGVTNANLNREIGKVDFVCFSVEKIGMDT